MRAKGVGHAAGLQFHAVAVQGVEHAGQPGVAAEKDQALVLFIEHALVIDQVAAQGDHGP